MMLFKPHFTDGHAVECAACALRAERHGCCSSAARLRAPPARRPDQRRAAPRAEELMRAMSAMTSSTASCSKPYRLWSPPGTTTLCALGPTAAEKRRPCIGMSTSGGTVESLPPRMNSVGTAASGPRMRCARDVLSARPCSYNKARPGGAWAQAGAHLGACEQDPAPRQARACSLQHGALP